MKGKASAAIVVVAVALAVVLAGPAQACTTILATKGATVDGSVIVAHSDDDELADQRLIYVPARDHKPGSLRPVYYSAVALGEKPQYNAGMYPRLVCPDRGAGYKMNDHQNTIPIGYIPQVEHTYAYFDGNYGIMNEHQLMIGECTNGAKVQPEPEPGKRIFYSAELSRVALERCTTAREAVTLMGGLIDTYGYYGTGETLLVGDTEEGWVMEMAGGTPDGTSGLWVAKRVPDGEVFVAANEFRIREIKRDDPSILYSDNLFDVARERGWWSPSDGPLDWLRTVSLGEYNHPYYSLRRVWRVQSKLAPSLNLSPWVEDGYTRAYPFSVKPDEKLTVRDVMNLYRDHYEGTQFDMTEGVAAGPFGYPNRYYGPYDGQGDVGDPHRDLAGAWERPLSVAYCGYTFVNQARGWLPDPIGGICWFGPDKPAETCFVPFYVGVSGLPEAYSTCDTDHFSRESAWWAFNFVANWSALKYSYMHQDIKRLQDSIELGELEASKKVDERAGKLLGESREAARRYLTEFCTTNAQQVVSRWWEFSEELIVRYNDGYINSPGHMAGEVGYPKEWLKRTDYYNGPTTYKEPEK